MAARDAEDPLADQVFERVEHVTPRLYRESGRPSTLTPEDIRRRLEAAFRVGAPAWDPYE